MLSSGLPARDPQVEGLIYLHIHTFPFLYPPKPCQQLTPCKKLWEGPIRGWVREGTCLDGWGERNGALAVRDGLQPRHGHVRRILQPCPPLQPLPPPPATYSHCGIRYCWQLHRSLDTIGTRSLTVLRSLMSNRQYRKQIATCYWTLL